MSFHADLLLSDPLTNPPFTPPSKRRKLDLVVVTPPRYSDLLAAFGARRVPSSVSKMSRENEGVRKLRNETKTQGLSYAESDDSDVVTPKSEASNFGGAAVGSDTRTSIGLTDSDGEEDGDVESEDDVIAVAPARSNGTRDNPQRSSKQRVSYATPNKPKRKKSSKGQKPVKLKSDSFDKAKSDQSKVHVETQRNKIRSDIVERIKPARNAFLYAHKEYFQPLLPETSYIDKLQRMYDMSGEDPATAPYTSISTQPTGITATMKPYQLEGLSFLVYMHKNGMSGILGDEMGLGKTLQTLALFQYLRENEPKHGQNQPFLVVCPLSVLSSWMSESKKWTPGLNAVRFHGPQVERDKLKDDCRVASKAAQIDIVVTTYETFTAEHSWFKRAFVWRVCVLDEGHKIKNEKSNVAHNLQGLQAEHRLLLTGTPLQNNLQEMWALLHWLYPEVFDIQSADKFKQAFDLTKGKVSTEFLDHARTLLELIMLRRMKNSPGVNLDLPPKEEILLYVPLTPMQRFWYTRILTKSDRSLLSDLFEGAKSKELQSRQIEAHADKAQNALLQKAADELAGNAATAVDVWAESKEIVIKALEQEQQANTNSSEWRKLMNLIMQLRKVCAHPYLLPGSSPEPYYLGDHIKAASGKFIVLDKLIDDLVIERGKKVLIFSGFTKTLDLCEDLLVLKGANAVNDASFRYLRLDGGTARARRNLGIRMFNQTDSEFRVMLISTRAGGLGINLASASDVVFMDEDWNPQITLQAEARAHRIGQTQKVTIYKLCTAGTVEEQMMGRIRKKLYLSAKVTESMRSIHAAAEQSGKKRKRVGTAVEDDTPQLDTTSLKSLIRRGAQTLSRPEIDVTEMMRWDWETTLEKCKDKPADAHIAENAAFDIATEQSWLNTMEKVECAVFDGKKHQKEIEAAAKNALDLTRADRRLGKNTTVMIDGFAINKESLNCVDWEAVPTMAGKDPRLAEPVRAKKASINNQEHCAVCWDGGNLVLCSGCPRSYHTTGKCIDQATKLRAKSKMQFYCPQHECVDCQGKTQNVGGMIYRCRFCEKGYCEDCLDWETANLVGETLPEYEMLGYGAMQNAWYIECPTCVAHWEEDEEDRLLVVKETEKIQGEYEKWLQQREGAQDGGEIGVDGPGMRSVVDLTSGADSDHEGDDRTPDTVSEVWTPMDRDVEHSTDERGKMRKLV